MITALVIGATGGVGTEVCKLLRDEDVHLIEINGHFDFTKEGADKRLSDELSIHSPDWVFNCAGVLGSNESTCREVFDVNIGINWALIQHYLHNTTSYPVKVMMMGSSSYSTGKPEYMLYSASKAALDNLHEGAAQKLPSISWGLLHPGPIDTKMIAHIRDPHKKYLRAKDVARELIDMCKTMTMSRVATMEAT